MGRDIFADVRGRLYVFRVAVYSTYCCAFYANLWGDVSSERKMDINIRKIHAPIEELLDRSLFDSTERDNIVRDQSRGIKNRHCV